MNPKAINDAYRLFASKGYTGSQDEFVSLISTNENAFNDAFTLFSSKGYSGGQDGFKSLMGIGVKKKDEQDSTLVQEDMASVTPSGMEQDSLLEQSQSQEEEPIQSFDETLLSDREADTFSKSFETITPELIGREEEFTVPKLNYQFNDYGFTFEEAGIGDAMKVRAKNGSEIRIDLDPFTGRGEREEAAKLKTFIQQNREESERLQRATSLAERKVRRVNNEQELKNTVDVFNQQTNALKDDMISFLEEKSTSDEVYETKFKGLTSQQIASNPKLKNQYDSWYGSRKELQTKFNELQLREQDIKTKGAQLDRIASEYAGMKAKQGTWLGGIYNSILKGFGVEASALSDFAQFVAMDVLDLELTDKDKKKDRIINEAVEYLKGVDSDVDSDKLKSNLSDMSMDELEKFLSGIDTDKVKERAETRMTSLGETKPDEKINLFEYSDDKVRDLTKKAIRYYDSDYESAKAGRKVNPYSAAATKQLAPEGINKALRSSIVDVLGDKETTEQWAEMQQQGFWGGAILGVAQSLPAMIGAGKFGAVQRIAQMTAQATDAISEEMENSPEFDNISEDERFYVKAPIGIAVGVLENIGFRNVINQKGLLNRAVSRALGKSNSKTTAKQFADFVREDVNSMMGRGLLTITGAGLAEFETGAAQELATLTVKEIYNQSKEKEMFKTPDTFYGWARDIMYAGAQEAIGGFILGVPSAVASAASTGEIESLSNEEFETFEMMSNDPEYKTMVITKQKQKILDGQMTQEEAEAENRMIDELQGLLQEIPNDLTTETKKEALQLILERNRLRKEIENKEPLLVKKQTERINEINNEIEQLEDKSIAQKKEAEQKLQEAKEGVSVFEDTQESESTEVAATEETQEQKDIAEMFSEDIAEVEAVSSNLAINSQGDVVRSEDDIPRVAEIIDRAKKAVVAVAKVLPQTKMILHESKDEFQRFTGTTGRGFFDPNTNTIHINLTDATQTTVPHEIFHAVLLNKIGTDAEVQVVVRDMVNSVAKVVKKGSVLSKRLDEFVSLYESEGDAMMNEERLAELTGILSASYSQLEAPQKSKVIEFIQKIASKFGIELGETFGQNDESVIDFLNTVSRKVAVGEEITDTDLAIVSGDVSGIVDGNARRQKSIFTDLNLQRFPTNPNTTVEEDVPLSRFNGVRMNVLESDRMTGAYIADTEGNPVFKFFGGLYFPIITGKWWASGKKQKANPIAKYMNQNREADGYIYAAPMIMSPKSHMSNQNMFEVTWEFIKHDLRSSGNKVTKKNFIEIIDKAFSVRGVKVKKEDIGIRKSDNIETILRKMTDVLVGDDATFNFEQRRKVIESILGDPKVKNRKFPTAGSISDMAAKFQEEATEKATQLWDIVMVMRTKGTLTARLTPTADEFYHKSYPYEITSDAPIEVLFLDGAYNLNETIPVMTQTKSGKEFSFEEYLKKHESTVKALSQYGRTAKMSFAAGEIISKGRKAREQKPMNQIIQESRDAGFKEDVIRDLLVRRLGMKATVVDKALAKFTDLFREFGEMPKSFGAMEGGLVASKKLFKKLQAFHRKEVRNNRRRKNKISQQEIMDRTINYMESLPEFKAEADTYVRNGKTVARQGYSTQQAKMVSDLQRMVNVRPTENVRQKVRDARKLIAEKRRRTSELKKIKYELRSLMRKTLPKALYTKQEALDLIQKIADADNSTIDNIIEEVFEFAIAKNNQILKQDIDRVLAKKTTRVESGRLKGKRVSVRIKETIDAIKSNLLPKDSTPESIDAKNAELNSRYNALDKIPLKSEAVTMEMTALKVAIEYNNSLQMDDTDSSKTESLDFVLNTLNEINDLGRAEFQQEIALEQEQFNSDLETAYEEIMGQPLDMESEDAQELLNETRMDMENEKEVEALQRRLKGIIKNISQKLRGTVFTSLEALDGLIDLISKSSGEMFGGKLQKITSELIDASSRNYKARKIYVESLIANELEKIYGKKWQKATRENAIQKVMTFGGKTMAISQNQMYYWYNQFKDPANHGSFKAMFGSKYKEVMADLEAALDPKVKAFADWQVNELFPQLYGHYNRTYRKIYKTNMPQNEKYAGRIYRKGVEPEPLDLLGEKSVFNTAVGAASTKSRTINKEDIEKFDGNDALFSYVRDMEYFAAYAEAVRRMDKMFNNKFISSAIKTIHGDTTYSLIKDSITKIANQGSRNPLLSKVVNSMNDVFILSRLALSPLITVKQLTSMFTYANDIGVRNWIKYSAMNLSKIRSTYREVAENSVYMQDRGREPITRAIESYGNASAESRTNIIPDNIRNTLVKVMMYNVKVGDAAAIYLGGMPNYLYYKDQYREKNPNATEQEAIDYAIVKFEKDTKRTQQSSDLQDKDFLQTGNPILRAMNMFMTTPRQYLRKEIQAVRNLYRKIKSFDKNAGKGTIKENLRTFIMYHFFMPMLFQYVSMGLPGLLRGWRDDDELDLLRAGLLGNLNAIFVLGEIGQWVSDAIAGKPYAGEQVKSLGILNQAQRMTKLYLRAERTKDPEKREANFKKFYIESMMLTGLPAPTLKKFVDNYSKIGTGDDIGMEIMRLLNYSEYQIYGPKNKKKKKMNMTIQEANEQYEKEQRKIQRKSKGLQNSGGYIPPSRR